MKKKAKAREQVRTQWPIDWHLARAPARGLLAPFAAPARIGFVGTCNNLILPGEKGGKRGGACKQNVDVFRFGFSISHFVSCGRNETLYASDCVDQLSHSSFVWPSTCFIDKP